MTAKEYLLQIKDIKKRIASYEEKEKELRERAKGVPSPSDQERVQTSATKALENTWAKLTQLSLDIDYSKEELIELEQEAWGLVSGLDDNLYVTILNLRYFVGRSWEYIQEHIGYEEAQTYRLHGYALQELSKKMIDNDSK